MTAIDITYEDGLRLAELTGQLRGLEYEASHMLATHIADLVLAVVLSILITFFVLSVISEYYCYNERCEQRLVMLSIALLIAIPVVAVALIWIYVNATLDLQMVEVQGQMDAILARYEAGA